MKGDFGYLLHVSKTGCKAVEGGKSFSGIWFAQYEVTLQSPERRKEQICLHSMLRRLLMVTPLMFLPPGSGTIKPAKGFGRRAMMPQNFQVKLAKVPRKN